MTALVGLGLGGSPLAIGLAIAVIATFQQLYFGPLFAAPVAIFGQGSAGLVSGAGNLFANLGGFAAGLGLGVVIDATGSLASGFLVIAGLCAVAVVATWALHRVAATEPPRGVESGAPPSRSPAR